MAEIWFRLSAEGIPAGISGSGPGRVRWQQRRSLTEEKKRTEMKKPETEEEIREFYNMLRRDPRQCLASAEEWVANDPQDVQALFDRHSAWLKLGQSQKAQTDLDSVIALDPNNPWNFLSRGDLHRQLGEYVQALDDYRRGEAIDPQEWQRHGIGLLFQADCEARLGNETAALSCASRLPDDFWTPGLFGAPRGGPDEIAAQLRQIARDARNRAKG